MKPTGLAVLSALIIAVFFASCRDKPNPMGPGEEIHPSLAVLDLEDKVDLLISRLYPPPGLLRSAKRRWGNIQRQMDRNPQAAQDQALEMMSDAFDFLAGGRLLDPDHPDIPVSTALDGVRLLSYYLYSFTGLEGVPELDQEFNESLDKGSGWITPEEGGEITTENGWAKLTVAPGETEEDILITIQLMDDSECDPGETLTSSLGCWDFDHYGGDGFEHVVEICVADPGPPEESGGMTDSEYYIDLRLHQQEEEEGSVPVALPYLNSTLDCSDFPVGEEGAPAPGPDEGQSILAAIGSHVVDFLLPEPLAALFRAVRRPPRGIGGLAGSFTWYFGALPLEEEEDYVSLPVGSGGAEGWDVVTPEVTEDLCNEANPINCPKGSVTEVVVSAVLTEDSGLDTDPWWEVFFYFRPEGESGPLSFIGSTRNFIVGENETNRFSTWEVTLNGSHPDLPDGSIEVFAVGARDPEMGGDIFATELASYIDVVSDEGVVPIQGISTMGAGGDFSCALRSDGKAFCWGDNPYGQLGDGTQTYSPTPVEVSGGHVFDQLFVGDGTACGLTPSGDAHCWGSNRNGQLGAGLPITLGDNFSLVPVLVSGGHSFNSLSIGLGTTCGTANDGMTYCWGGNRNGELGNGTTGGESTVPVPVTNSQTLGFVRVSAGFFSTCALDGDGAPYCWGYGRLFGNDPQSANANTPTPAASGLPLSAIEIGIYSTCGIDGNADMHCWGMANQSGEQGNGSVLPEPTPTPVVGGLSFESLDANNNNTILGVTCGVTPEGEAWCWGTNRKGQLGGSTTETCTPIASWGPISCATSPITVDVSFPFSTIHVGNDHVCGLDGDGTAYCWGNNQTGQLGNGTLDPSPVPVAVGELTETPGAGPIVVTPLMGSVTLLGGTLQFSAEAQDRDGIPLAPQPPFIWTSSNPAVAMVDASGLVTAVSDGTAVLHVNAPDGATGRATINVKITDPVQAFNQAINGDSGDGIIVLGGLLTDEWGRSGTYPTHYEVDHRNISLSNSSVEYVFNKLGTARVALEFEAARLQSVDPANPMIGDLFTRAGFVYLAYAQNWCSGVPLDDPTVGVSTVELFDLAVARFDGAIRAPISPDFVNASRVGRARAYQELGNYAAAIADAATVPTGFSLDIVHTTATGEQNGVYLLNTDRRRITLSDLEGGNGSPFRSAGDERVTWTRAEGGTAVGFDQRTPQYDLLKYPAADTPMPLATGIEARLIQAEVLMLQNDQGGYLNQLNAVRAYFDMAPLVNPGTFDERVDLLFSERAFSLMATGHRLWDLRRLVSAYGRSPATVFPTGDHPQGGIYGTDGNLPVPTSARGPGFAGCTVRTH